MIVTSQTSYRNGGCTSNIYLKKNSKDVIEFFLDFIKENYEDYYNSHKYHVNFTCSCRKKVCYEFINNINENVCDIIDMYNYKKYDSCYNYEAMGCKKPDSDSENEHIEQVFSAKKNTRKNKVKKLNKMIEILELEKLKDRIMTKEEKEEYEKNFCDYNSSSSEESNKDDEKNEEDYDGKDHILNTIYKTENGNEYKQAINSVENCEIEKIIFLTLDDYVKNRLNKKYFCNECNDNLMMKKLNIGNLFDRILDNESIGGYWLGAESLGINIRRVNLKLDCDDILTQYDFRS